MNENRQLLRHALATVAYRATRALEGAPASFARFSGCGRTPVEILAHIGDLFDWAWSIAEGNQRWSNAIPAPWPEEVERFYASLEKFDAYLASDAPLNASAERLLQGPIADALTHIGQLAMMRRMAECPTKGENFYVAEVTAGNLSANQAKPVKPF